VNREAELDRPSRVACSDLLGVMVSFNFRLHPASENLVSWLRTVLAQDANVNMWNHNSRAITRLDLDVTANQSRRKLGLARKRPNASNPDILIKTILGHE